MFLFLVQIIASWQDALEGAPDRGPTRPIWTADWSGSAAHTRQPQNEYRPMPVIADGPSNYVRVDYHCPSAATQPSYHLLPGGVRGHILPQVPWLTWKKNWGIHTGHTGTMPDHISQIQAGVLNCHPNQLYGQDRSTSQWWCQSHVSSAHLYQYRSQRDFLPWGALLPESRARTYRAHQQGGQPNKKNETMALLYRSWPIHPCHNHPR